MTRAAARAFSTALVRFGAGAHYFPRNGVLVGASLSAALSAAPPSAALPATFLAACAAAPTPLATAPLPAAAAATAADYVFLVDDTPTGTHVRAFEGGAEEPTFSGDARAFARLVEVGFGQC